MRWPADRDKKTEQNAILEYKEKYRILTEIMPLGAVCLGPAPEYPVVFANLTFARMFGYDSEEAVIGISAQDIILNPAHWQLVETDLASNDAVFQRELQLRQKDGGGICVVLHVRKESDDDNRGARIDAVVEDVTERKIFEIEMHYHQEEMNRYASALTQANKKLNLLSSITRHDILNQLTALAGYLDIMSEEAEDPTLQKYITAEKRIAETIRKQVQFTRDYHEIGVQSPQWYNVKKTIEAVTANLPVLPGSVVIDIENLSIYADPLLEKVFYNLVENALRHGRNVSRITFSCSHRGESIRIVCEDDGDGIPEELKEAIFNRQHFKNTGFGLFLSREILGITGLLIHENGEPGKGARFEITVPQGYFRT